MLKLSPLRYPRAMFVLNKSIHTCEVGWDFLVMLQRYLDRLLYRMFFGLIFTRLWHLPLYDSKKET